MAVRIGLIGCGIISGEHLEGYRLLAGQADVVAVADVDAARARAAAERFGVPRWHTGWREVVAAPDVDAVDICLPHHLHPETTLAALEAGKHVLCEKPIANTLEEADTMIAAAGRAGRILMIAEHCRFMPEVARARELLDEGVIGRPILIESVHSWYQGGDYLKTPWRFDPGKIGGGALMDAGIHFVDILLNLMGPAQEVFCLTTRVRDVFPTEDTAVMVIRFANGVMGHFTVGWAFRNLEPLLFRISGSEGVLSAHLRSGGIEVISERTGGKPAFHPVAPANPIHREVAHFVECVLTGSRPAMGGAEARADVEFVLKAYESARTGRVVRW